MKTEKQPLSIYIHIPFCVKKCLYCDFLSAPAGVQLQESYVRALIDEIHAYASQKFTGKYEVISVFFGGGTPSLLKAEWVRKILETLKQHFRFACQPEISLECNPKTASKEKLDAFLKAGVNRLSIGLQSSNNRELKRLGRIHSYEEFLDTYYAARKAGFQNINIDVMAALPGQTLRSYEETLSKVLMLEPEHISAYQLIIEKGTPFYELYGEEKENSSLTLSAEERLPDEDTEREMYYTTKRMLAEKGYERYEISNYSKKGFACRHNLSYWTGIDYMGFGIGAASLVQGFRYSCTRNLKEYINICTGAERLEKIQNIYENVQRLTVKNRMEEFMFLGLRLTKGISKKEFRKIFGLPIEEVYQAQLEKMERLELLVNEKTETENSDSDARVYLTERGLDLANIVMAEFLFD